MSLSVESVDEGRLLRISLAHGKGNVFDTALVDALRAALAAATGESLRAVLLDSAGPHFSYGASVEEHLPSAVAGMFERFHGLVRQLLDLPVPLLVAVRGQCLGGALEVALAATRLIAHPTAVLGLPEVKLGVFAPAGSALLPLRVGQAKAEALLLSGRVVTAAEALDLGLVQEVCAAEEDPTARALDFARRAFSPLSASSLRFATQAARQAFREEGKRRLDLLEKLYLHELMKTRDAVEGIEAFIAKRPPRWQTA